MTYKGDIAAGERFRFGDNWSSFLRVINDSRIEHAKQSLCEMLDVTSLDGKTFLDIGSGSGLFSLAARSLGATVYSFDYDQRSVECTQELKDRFYPNDNNWVVDEGSVLDSNYLCKYNDIDIIYSWGVLHHTGEMWVALKNVSELRVKNGGKLFIALYNNQGWVSSYWACVKKTYNKNILGRYCMIAIHSPYLFVLRYLIRLFSGRLNIERGMSMWRDMIDWLGGYPFEVVKPEEVFDFFRLQDYQLLKLKTVGCRMGCNEFVFEKN